VIPCPPSVGGFKKNSLSHKPRFAKCLYSSKEQEFQILILSQMKNTQLLILLIGGLLLSITGTSQLDLDWSKNIGGSEDDLVFGVDQTNDGGFIIAGWSESSDGDLEENKGGRDAWIVKFDSEENIEWGKNYGGSMDDTALAIKQTSDGGFIAAGWSRSINGDLDSNYGQGDVWVFKLDFEGKIIWSKTYGGSNADYAVDIVETSDEGYVLAAVSGSWNSDVTGNNGMDDYWIVKLDSSGNLLWEKTYGTVLPDRPTAIILGTDGGYIICGSSWIGNTNGGQDGLEGWVIKLNDSGNLQWVKRYGGRYVDYIKTIETTIDGGYIMAGGSKSDDGDLTENNGETDAWIIKTDAAGNIEWSKSYGGFDDDDINSIVQTVDDGYIMAGLFGITSGDSWLMKLDPQGNFDWAQTYGGTNRELAIDFIQKENGEFIVVNYSDSVDEDIVENKGLIDLWLFKINPMISSNSEIKLNNNVTISPNPSNGEFTIDIKDVSNNNVNVLVYDALGHTVISKKEVSGSVSIHDLPQGNYLVQIVGEEFSVTRKIIIH